ncbi:PREDICTED: adenosine receptor A2a-like [Acropora digitifera]|uniref:adenosine receptor A2a-like n=1 Tax=Acropora digitifera TaxID=70779 RepID=UPI00077B0FE2|nr:PREDICTED: adenosine receptor A2a-like [Acropora digitifera]
MMGARSPSLFERMALYCSAEFSVGLYNQLVGFSVANVVLALTAVLGNTLILIALHKETSLHPPSKILLRSLTSSYLCLGVLTLVLQTSWISIALKQWKTCQYLYTVHYIASSTLFGVSLFTTTAISVDRLLALLLGLRYRQIVTVKRVYAAVVVIWVSSFSGLAVQFYIVDEKSIIGASSMFLCLILSMYCYLRIYLKLRHRQIEVRQANQTTPISLPRYRNSVCNALWMQLVLVFCVIPFCVITPFTYPTVGRRQSSALHIALISAATLAFFNASVNPFLYCWKIKQVRRAVKNTLKQISCTPNE